VEKNDAVLRFVFETLLKLWHPFMPYVTEALWETLGNHTKNLLMIERWPASTSTQGGPKKVALTLKADDAERFQLIIDIIQKIRAVRSFSKIDPAKLITVTIRRANERILVQDNGDIFKHLARISDIHITDGNAAPEKSILVQSGLLQVFINLEGIVDIKKERERFKEEKEDKEKYIMSLETKLSNKNFIARAKPDIVEAERMKLEETKKQLADLKHHLASLL